MYQVVRFPENPIIHTGLHPALGENINGPSLIRVPDWVEQPLGRYYLYFAHHKGTYIRMAYADDLHGPWTIYPGGVLHVEDTVCRNHIASPDVVICPENQSIRMYFHGATGQGQRSFLATSQDGLLFEADVEVLGDFYFRVFRHAGSWYAIAKRTDAPGGGVLYRSADGIRHFEKGPYILPNQRHVAVRKCGDLLDIFYSRGGDSPERILLSKMALSGDWRSWEPSDPITILEPATEAEGVTLPLRTSQFGAAVEPLRELRDPAIFEEEGHCYLLYTGAGEQNICVAVLEKQKPSA